MTPFLSAYIECALWSSTDNSTESGGYPLDDNYGPEDIHSETLSAMARDCRDFQKQARDLLSLLPDVDDEQHGHDFWLTRNRHGAGFWDRGYPRRIGEFLTDIAHSFGGADLYVNRGRVYQYGARRNKRKAA